MNQETFPQNVQFPNLASEIETMVKADQDMREKNLQNEDFWDENLDRKNTERMKEIIAEIGWPTISKVGLESAHSCWLLVQHADHDVDFQRRCLELMKQAPEGEVSKQDIAYLEDRVRVNQNQPQLYGTQFTQDGEKHIPKPIEDQERVDSRRTEMGLDALQKGIDRMNEKYTASSEA